MIFTELDRILSKRSKPLKIWFRDDDAQKADQKLYQLLELGRKLEIEMLLAVVPAGLEQDAVSLIRQYPDASIGLHGWSHENNAYEGEKKIEFGGRMKRSDAAMKIRKGVLRLQDQFPDQFLPVFIPPWNRVESSLLPLLKDEGIKVLSTFASDTKGRDAGFIQSNSHLDFFTWHGPKGPKFKTAEEISDELLGALDGFKEGLFGLLGHHLVQADADFVVLQEFLSCLKNKACISFPAIKTMITR